MARGARRHRVPRVMHIALRMIKLNLRWFIQALALASSIYCFMTVFNSSKTLFTNFSFSTVLPIMLWAALFCCSFFVLMFTSYLKQRGSHTLRHRISSFETLVRILRLENYEERKTPAPIPPA